MARYMVIVQLHIATPERVKFVVPQLAALLEKISSEKPELAFRSLHADLFGYCIISDRSPQEIHSRIETPAPNSVTFVPPVLAGEDGLFVIELGEYFRAGKGFTRIGAWLQHHH